MEPIRVEQNGVARYKFKLVDEDQNPVPLAGLSSLVATLYDKASDTIINSRSQADIRNTNGGTYHATNGKGTLLLGVNDNPIVNVNDPATPVGEEETHVLLLEAAWQGGTRVKRWEVVVYVTNLHRV